MRNHAYFLVVLFSILSVCIIRPTGGLAQSLISTKLSMMSGNNTTGVGRDYWLTVAQNYDDQGGKYYEFFIVSERSTTVHIAVTGGTTANFPTTAGQVLSFFMPLAWELTTSGTVEQKALHVWSNDANLTVNILSRNPASSDGYYGIPCSGWGKKYVVASYASLFEGYGTFVYDYASEFCLVSNQDSTLVNIVPATDLRMTSGAPVKKAGIPFTITLNKGECVQYKAVAATDCGIDVTGTVVTSSKPVGLIGASQCPNVPCEFGDCDHVCEMIPPIRSWGKTYHTVPFDTRKLGDSYLVISTVPRQQIFRNNVLYVTFDSAYQLYLRPDISEASLWTSASPFLLVQ